MAFGDPINPVNSFPYTIPPITGITPFTYRDGTTYLEVLARLQDWLNNVHVPEVNDQIAQAVASFQAGIANAEAAVTSQDTDWTTKFNSFMSDVNANLQSLNDHAMATLVDQTAPASETRAALDLLYATKAWSSTIDTLVNTGRLSQTALDAAYQPKGSYAASGDVSTLQTEVNALDDPTSTLGAKVRTNANGIGRSQMPTILLAADLGADPTGATPADDAFATAMSRVVAAGGGAIMLDGAKFLFNQPWTIPSTGDAHVPVEIYGRGMRTSGAGQETDPGSNVIMRVGGTQAILNVQNTGAAPIDAKIILNQYGVVRIHDMLITQTGSPTDTTPFVGVTRSTLLMHNVEIMGHLSLWGTTCVQPGIIFGTPSDQFSGYGTRLENVTFNRLKKCMGFYRAANNIMVVNPSITGLCGSNDSTAAIEFDGQSNLNSGNQARGNNIYNLIFELCYYKYGVSFANNANQNTLYSPGFWDMTGSAQFSNCIDLRAGGGGNAFLGVQADTAGKNAMFNNPSNLEKVYQFAGLTQSTALGASWLDIEPDGANNDGGITAGMDLKLWPGAGHQVRIYNSSLRLGAYSNATRPAYAQGDCTGTLIFNTDAKKLQLWTGTAWETVTSA